MIKYLSNQILSWSKDRNIGYLSIYCSCWSTLNSILRIPLYIRYLVLKHQYHYQNTIKSFTIPGQYNKDNAYWADLFTRVKSWIKKIGMDMIYLPIFNFWDYIFMSTNSLLLFGYIDFKLIKDNTLLIKVLKLMIHTRSPWVLQKLFTKLMYKLSFTYVSV